MGFDEFYHFGLLLYPCISSVSFHELSEKIHSLEDRRALRMTMIALRRALVS
jgi:hypothetical protein